MARKTIKLLAGIIEAVLGHTSSRELARANGRDLRFELPQPDVQAGPVSAGHWEATFDLLRRHYEPADAGRRMPEAALFAAACRASGLSADQWGLLDHLRRKFQKSNYLRREGTR